MQKGLSLIINKNNIILKCRPTLEKRNMRCVLNWKSTVNYIKLISCSLYLIHNCYHFNALNLRAVSNWHIIVLTILWILIFLFYDSKFWQFFERIVNSFDNSLKFWYFLFYNSQFWQCFERIVNSFDNSSKFWYSCFTILSFDNSLKELSIVLTILWNFDIFQPIQIFCVCLSSWIEWLSALKLDILLHFIV